MKKYLVGKQFKPLNNLFGNAPSGGAKRVLFVYSPGDCSSCLEIGHKFIDSITLVLKTNVDVVCDTTNVSDVIPDFLYARKIYTSDRAIRDQLQSTYSPIFMLVDNKSAIIENVYFPILADESNDRAEFFLSIRDTR